VYFYRAAESICVEPLLKDALALIRELTDEVAKAKADTVNRMYIEIKERCIKGGIYPAFVARTTADVAKELLEEGK
jgi:phosphate uptake regulator